MVGESTRCRSLSPSAPRPVDDSRIGLVPGDPLEGLSLEDRNIASLTRLVIDIPDRLQKAGCRPAWRANCCQGTGFRSGGSPRGPAWTSLQGQVERVPLKTFWVGRMRARPAL